MSERTRIQATIKRASKQAREDADQLDGQAAGLLTDVWQALLADVLVILSQHSAANGNLRAEYLGRIKAQIETRLDAHRKAQADLLDELMLKGAQLGVKPFTGTIGAFELELPAKTVVAVKRLVIDGLQLSDRIWDNVEDTKAIFKKRITAAVVRGQSAAEAALDMMANGQPLDSTLDAKLRAQHVQNVYAELKKEVMDQPYQNMRRVFRTEINRAHGSAYQSAVEAHPDAVGTRFLLSPNHPKTDICDLHARVNRYGLGKGVYPVGKNPWPAHPNTLSYTEVVFADEVSADDRTEKSDRIEFLKKQTLSNQRAILGKNKSIALQHDLLKENEINTPWHILKARYASRGVDLSLFD